MEVEGSCLDTISTRLPHDVTAKILSCLPIQDALRTSILSKKWRYRWASMPVVKFDDKKLFERSSHTIEIIKYKFVVAISHVLLLHSGPLVEFTLLCELEMASEVDQIILYLSRSNTLKKFTFINRLSKSYKLPSLFFSLQGLEHINITNCNFDPPLTFNGFSSLRFLRISNAEINTEILMCLLTNCLLLQNVYLLGENKDITRGNKSTFVDLLECLPSVMFLGLSSFYLKHFALGGMRHKLPTPLVHLKSIFLSNVCFMDQDELFSTLFLINNSPNLFELGITLAHRPSFVDGVDLQDYSGIKLDRLEVLEIIDFCNLAIEMQFVKLAMAKAHMLKVLRIEVSVSITVDEEVRMLRDLIRLPFPRASPSAMLIIDRRK